MSKDIHISRLTTIDDAATIAALSGILIDCVDKGASVGFLHPLTGARADAFWKGLVPSITNGSRMILVAKDAGGNILGTVQIVLAQPENQPHRADISKLLVHSKARRAGLGEALMKAAEASAISANKTVLVLDTASGCDAVRLYQRLGWQLSGIIPDYAMWPDGSLVATTIFYKHVGHTGTAIYNGN